VAPPLRDCYTALQKHGPHLIDQRRSCSHEPVAGTVQRLQIELAFALQFNKAHGRSRRCFCNRFGIAVIVLLRLNVGTHILGRHQSDLVAHAL
jgi:hypothetical protein